ncbi:MAG: DUF3177 family protein [Cyanobacteria bacterium P01_A01_bin.135]
MSQDLLRSLVWMDYRLAVLFTVIVPLVLLVWAFMGKQEAITRLLIIYWRVLSLLAITVYLMIGGFPFSIITGIASRILIPICLWFWVDINEEIAELPASTLKIIFTSWRWTASLYGALGAIAMVPFLPCAFDQQTFGLPFCQVWFEAPLMFREYFHANLTPGFLGFLGIVGLIVYLLCLGYFVFIRLSKEGRSALER